MRSVVSVTAHRLVAVFLAAGVGLAFLISGSSACADTIIGAGLSHPHGVAVDRTGDVFIADTWNDRVVVDKPSGSGGYTQSVVDSGVSFPEGVAVDGSGDVFIADTGNNRVVVDKPDGSGGYTRSLVDTRLNNPGAVAVDGSGDVFIVDDGNHRVVLDTPNGSGGYTQRVIDASMFSPSGVAVDRAGDLFIADTDDQRVVVDKPNGSGSYTQSLVDGHGLSYPEGVAVDGSGDVFTADTVNNRVVVDTPNGSGGYTQSVVDTGLNDPFGVAVDGSGDVFTADTYNSRVVEHAAPVHAALTYPMAGQTNVTTTTPFSWADITAGQGYQLWIGTSRGDGSLLKSGPLPATTSTYQMPALPTGVTLWATLYTQVAGNWGNWQAVPFTVTASRDAFTYPTAGQQNINTLTPLSWSPATGAQGYRLTIGTNPGAADLVNSGILAANVTSYREPALPTGKTLYARLAWEINGSWSDYQDVSFTAAPNPVAFTHPIQGQTAVSTPATFTWSTSPAATGYQLWVGTSRGSGNLLKSGLLNPSTSTYQLPALPAGQTLWARIYTGVASGWGNWEDISFTTAAGGSNSDSALTNLTRQSTITNQLAAHADHQPTPAWMRRLLRLEPNLRRFTHARPR
jgi:NHL repeat